MEKSGRPGIVITTEKFIELGRLESKALGMPDLHFELIPHPLGGLKPEVAEERGRKVADAIVAYLARPKGRQP